MADEEFPWDETHNCVTSDGYEAQITLLGCGAAKGVVAVVQRPWGRPIVRLFQRSPDVGREIERIIRADRHVKGIAPRQNAPGSDKFH